VHDGINLVREVLKPLDDGRPRLTVSSSCVHLISEFESYIWRNDFKKDEPIKVNDHALDALRYLIHYLFSLRELTVLEPGKAEVIISDKY
jgi:phage terminase large subunit